MGARHSIPKASPKIQLPPQKPIKIKSSTWLKENSNLYDFTEKVKLQTEEFEANSEGTIYRKGTDVFFKPDKSKTEPNQGAEALLKIVNRDGNYYLEDIVHQEESEGNCQDNEQILAKMPWILTKKTEIDDKTKNVALKSNDILKFGKVKFRVKKIFTGSYNEELPSPNTLNNKLEQKSLARPKSHFSFKTNKVPPKIQTQKEPAQSPDGKDKKMSIPNFQLLDDVSNYDVASPNAQKIKNPYLSPMHRKVLFNIQSKTSSPASANIKNLSPAIRSHSNSSNDSGDNTPKSPERKFDFKLPDKQECDSPKNIYLDFKSNDIALKDVADSNQDNTESDGACRICLDDESEPDNPIVYPCKCIGSVKNVHVKCLRHWISRKVTQRKSTNLISIFWKPLKCELCNSECHQILKKDGREFDLIEIPTVDVPHVILEYFINDSSLGYHMLLFSQNKSSISLGRGDSCDILVSDNTISRKHGCVSFKEGKFYLEDQGSRFGTSILIDQFTEPLNPSKALNVQVGRTLLEFTIKT